MPSSRLLEADELVVALACLFALDILTVIEQDYPPADRGSTLSDFGRNWTEPSRMTGGRARASAESLCYGLNRLPRPDEPAVPSSRPSFSR